MSLRNALHQKTEHKHASKNAKDSFVRRIRRPALPLITRWTLDIDSEESDPNG